MNLYCLVIFAIVLISRLEATTVQNVTYASSTKLKCPQRGKVEWYLGGEDKSETLLTNTINKYEIVDDELTIHDLRTIDLTYPITCKNGELKEEFSLKSGPAFFVNDKSSQTQTEGMNAEFQCKLIVGFQHGQKVEWTWYFGDAALATNASYSIITEEDGNKSTLHVRSVTMANKGQYKCHASNAIGHVEQEFTLRVKNTLAALWPFIGIIVEVAVLCIIILVFEKKCGKKSEDEGEQVQTLMSEKEKTSEGTKKRSGK